MRRKIHPLRRGFRIQGSGKLHPARNQFHRSCRIQAEGQAKGFTAFQAWQGQAENHSEEKRENQKGEIHQENQGRKDNDRVGKRISG